MPSLPVHLDGDECWPDLGSKGWEEASRVEVAVLPGGMSTGKPSVTIRFDMPDGRVVLGQTSMALFVMAARMMVSRYGEPG
jgi:hypothetical protein